MSGRRDESLFPGRSTRRAMHEAMLVVEQAEIRLTVEQRVLLPRAPRPDFRVTGAADLQRSFTNDVCAHGAYRCDDAGYDHR